MDFFHYLGLFFPFVQPVGDLFNEDRKIGKNGVDLIPEFLIY
jgi:hypothetical protein